MLLGLYRSPVEGSGESKEASLTKSIEAAAITAAKEMKLEIKEDEVKDEKKEEVKEEKKEEKKEVKEEVKKEEKKEEDELDPEKLAAAKQLFKVLSSPNADVQRAGLEALARAAGLKLEKIETKAEVKEAKESLLDLLKGGLGEYDFLSEKLAPILEKALKQMVAEETKDLRETVKTREEREVKDQIKIGYDAAFAKYDNSSELQEEVLKVMDEFKPTGKMSHEAYFNSCLLIAADRKDIELKKVSGKAETKETKEAKEKKIEKSRNDVGSRVGSERAAEVKVQIKPSHGKGLNAAVQSAIDTLANEK
jgi:hypothetical protein